MRVEKILKQTEYIKLVQVTEKNDMGTFTYTLKYVKVFHKSIPGGSKWTLNISK